MKHPFLIGKNVYLRGLEKEDLTNNYFQWFNDHEVCNYNAHGRFPNNPKKMEAYLDEVFSDNSTLVLAIISKSDDVHIGNISLQCVDWISRNAEYAIIMGEKEYKGKGLSKEAGDLILEHGFIALNLHRVYCAIASENIAAQRMVIHMGMILEGVRRQAHFKKGQYKDMNEYGILVDEYLLNRAKINGSKIEGKEDSND